MKYLLRAWESTLTAISVINCMVNHRTFHMREPSSKGGVIACCFPCLAGIPNMKCVRIVGQGVPCRMSDVKAREIVEHDKDGEYCSKSFFKNWWRKVKEIEADEHRIRNDARGTKVLPRAAT